MPSERVTFDGVTVDLVDVTSIESPFTGPMLAGYEVATGRFHRIAFDLIDGRLSIHCTDEKGATMPETAQRAVRIDDDTWNAAQDRAALESRTVSDVIRIALRAYADGKYDAIPQPVRRKRE